MIDKPLTYAFSRASDDLGDPVKKVPMFDAVYQEWPELEGLKEGWPKHQGAYGYLGFLDKKYAVKAAKQAFYSFEITLPSFIKECDCLTKIDHPLVPKIYGISKIFNMCVMDQMPGIPLKEIPMSQRTKKQNERIVDTLVQFSSDVSKICPVEDYPDMPICDEKDIPNLISNIQNSDCKAIWGDARYNEYMKVLCVLEGVYNSVDPVMHHGDFHPRNILINPDDYGEVTGLVDFGLFGKYQLPEVHYSVNLLDEDMCRMFSSSYHHQRTNKQVDNLIHLYRAFVHIEDASEDPRTFNEKKLRHVDLLASNCKL